MGKLSIPEKIRTKSNKKGLGLSKNDLEIEIIRLYQAKDSNGLLDLFEAYRDWELKYRTTRTVEETLELTKKKFRFFMSCCRYKYF